jgi:hypothetical protein
MLVIKNKSGIIHRLIGRITHGFYRLIKNFLKMISNNLRADRPIALFYAKFEKYKKKQIDCKKIYSHPLIDTDEAKKIADFFCGNIEFFKKSYSLLNVGIGLNIPPHWLSLFKDVLLYKQVGSIEAYEHYIKMWPYHLKYPVWRGDIMEIDNLFPPKSVDTILWAQGPEHIPLEYIKPTYLKVKNIARHHIIFVTPWGGYYDDQEEINNNPYERHRIKQINETIYKGTNLKILKFGEYNKANGGMLAYEFLLHETKDE